MFSSFGSIRYFVPLVYQSCPVIDKSHQIALFWSFLSMIRPPNRTRYKFALNCSDEIDLIATNIPLLSQRELKIDFWLNL